MVAGVAAAVGAVVAVVAVLGTKAARACLWRAITGKGAGGKQEGDCEQAAASSGSASAAGTLQPSPTLRVVDSYVSVIATLAPLYTATSDGISQVMANTSTGEHSDADDTDDTDDDDDGDDDDSIVSDGTVSDADTERDW
jgi:hypothetical protein